MSCLKLINLFLKSLKRNSYTWYGKLRNFFLNGCYVLEIEMIISFSTGKKERNAHNRDNKNNK